MLCLAVGLDRYLTKMAVYRERLLMCVWLTAGNWNNAAKAGVFYRNWNNNRSNDNNNIGFRCADYFAKTLTSLNGYTGNIGINASCILAKSAWNGFLVLLRNVSRA